VKTRGTRHEALIWLYEPCEKKFANCMAEGMVIFLTRSPFYRANVLNFMGGFLCTLEFEIWFLIERVGLKLEEFCMIILWLNVKAYKVFLERSYVFIA